MLGWTGAMDDFSLVALGSELSAFPQLVGLPLLALVSCFLTIMASSWPCST